jgi:hypothetical protein
MDVQRLYIKQRQRPLSFCKTSLKIPQRLEFFMCWVDSLAMRSSPLPFLRDILVVEAWARICPPAKTKKYAVTCKELLPSHQSFTVIPVCSSGSFPVPSRVVCYEISRKEIFTNLVFLTRYFVAISRVFSYFEVRNFVDHPSSQSTVPEFL